MKRPQHTAQKHFTELDQKEGFGPLVAIANTCSQSWRTIGG